MDTLDYRITALLDAELELYQVFGKELDRLRKERNPFTPLCLLPDEILVPIMNVAQRRWIFRDLM
jgi:hypothetical protein